MTNPPEPPTEPTPEPAAEPPVTWDPDNPPQYAAGSAQVPARYEPTTEYEPITAYGGPPEYGYGYAPAAPTNNMAIVGLVLSLVGLFTGITAPMGAILGHVAKSQIRQSGEAGGGMATAAIVVGWIVTALYLLCCGALFLLPFALMPAFN